ncbi:MAG: sigma-70 family RNA polymerase sigma factor [Planctomycetota bacterium]
MIKIADPSKSNWGQAAKVLKELGWNSSPTEIVSDSLFPMLIELRTTFQETVLSEWQVVRYFVSKFESWQAKKIRLDTICNFALNDLKKRQLIEPRIIEAIKIFNGMIRECDRQQDVRIPAGIHRRIVQLMASLEIRPGVFHVSPFSSQKASDQLAAIHAVRNEIVERNLGLVKKTARELCSMEAIADDLFQEGSLGLMHAVTKFDPFRKIKFSTYAIPWIRQFILAALPNAQKNIRIPDSYRSKTRKVLKRIEELERGSEPYIGRTEEFKQVVASELGEEIKSIEQRQRISVGTQSIFEIFGERNSNVELARTLLDRKTKVPTQWAILKDQQFLWSQAMKATLTDKEEQVIRLRFGLSDGESRSLSEVGREMKLTRERIRQIEKPALEKLAQTTEMNLLLSDFDPNS